MKPPRSLAALPLLLLAPAAAALGPSPVAQDAAPPAPTVTADEPAPGRAPIDAFHPEGDVEVEPAFGGRVVIHLRGHPRNLNYTINGSAFVRWLQYELHERLFQRDWETWEWRGVLVDRWEVEDTLVLKDGGHVFGRVTDAGEAWRVEAGSPRSPLEAPRTVEKSEVESLERGTVYTLHLRDDVVWHDGHPFDAKDVAFSFGLYANEYVDCDKVRALFQPIRACEVLDDHTVRFHYAHQYFNVLEALNTLSVLPAHVYDLADPQNPDHDPDATAEEQGKFVNEHPRNTEGWIGLGPYRLKRWDEQYIDAERFDGYFDPENGGHVDEIRWRHIPNDDTAFQALINGEIDFYNRLTGDQYFGDATAGEEFTRDYYKGYYYNAAYNYCPWNTRRPQLSDPRVRIALAHCFDFDEYVRTIGHGLGKVVTGPQFYFGPAYDRDVEPFPLDLARAEELFAEAGWYDRDGDGVIDKDGVPFELDFLVTNNNVATKMFVQKYQENLEQVGVKLNIEALEWATLYERVKQRDFDVTSMAWSLPIESDPEQLWHSAGAAEGNRGSNYPSVADPHVDELIRRGQRELDDEKRWAIWRELHRYLYREIQPYLFREMPPRKFGLSKAIRGVQTFAIAPGYSLRRWYYPAGTPGTRPTLEK